MHGRHLVLVCFTMACGSEQDTPQDPCAEIPVMPGGSAELGLGRDFAPVTADQDVDVQLGAQGLWMFVVNVRVRDLQVGTGDDAGVVAFVVRDPSGAQISPPTGCRVLEFDGSAGGALQMVEPYSLPLLPDVTSRIEGATMTIAVDVRDREGRHASDERAVTAHLPDASRARASGVHAHHGTEQVAR